MSVFQLFWNLILGISGGIISGIIVSRIFLIQGDFQNQINSFDLLLRKLGYTSGMLFGIRTVQEFSYDSDIKMHNEMEKEGISTEEQYYKAHIDVNWISKDRLVSDLLKECKKINTSLKDELMDLHINESGFHHTILLIYDSSSDGLLTFCPAFSNKVPYGASSLFSFCAYVLNSSGLFIVSSILR